MTNSEVREKLLEILDIIQNKKTYEYIQPKTTSDVIMIGNYVYDDSLYALQDIIGDDNNYIENYKKIKDKEVEHLTKNELTTLCTRIFRGERFYDGNIALAIENGILEKIIKRYLEIC